jgi:tetratricopeptide (TPR) repeat protein
MTMPAALALILFSVAAFLQGREPSIRSKGGLSGMISAFFFGACGALVTEVLKRWQQWNNVPEGRFLALLQNKEFWFATLFLVLLGGSVGLFEASKTRPFDWSVCFFVSAGVISIIRNFFSGLAARGSSRAKRRRLRSRLRPRHGDDVGPTGKGLLTKIEQKSVFRPVPKTAFETLRPPQEPVLEETERALQKAIRLYPQNAGAHYILGVLLKECGRLEEAGQAFEGAIRLNLQDAEAHYNLGVSLKENGRFEEAERAFQTAIRLNPRDASGSGSVAGSPQELRPIEQLSSLGEKVDGNPRTSINWRDIFN